MDEEKNNHKPEIYVLIFVLFCLGLALAEIFGNIIAEIWF